MTVDPFNTPPDALLEKLPEHELRCVLGSVFNSVTADEDAATYIGSDGPAVTLRYRKGTLVEIRAEATIAADQAARAIEAVTTAASDAEAVAARSILFAPVPAVGYWRYQDTFQIGEPPAGAPLPPFLLGAHPFVLETRIRASDDHVLRLVRAEHAAQETRLFLNVAMGWPLTWPHRSTSHEWVYPDGVDDFVPVYRQVGYHIPGLDTFSDDWRPSTASMPVVGDDEAYGRRGITPGETLTVPARMESLLNRFYSLPPLRRAQFTRAGFWFSHSGRVWALSKSASFIALVQALEALVDPATGGGNCEQCGRWQGRSAFSLFSELLEEYAGDVPEAERRAFYKIRSKLSHGEVLHDDVDVSFGGLNPVLVGEMWKQDALLRATRIVLINWLIGVDT